VKTDDEVDAGSTEPVDVLDLDMLAIEEMASRSGWTCRVLTSSSSSTIPEATESSSSEQEPRPFFLRAVFAAFREREEPRRPTSSACTSSE
jgi:hypothetical protein